MKNRYEFYIPVKKESGAIRLNANKLTSLKGIIPEDEIIDEFFKDMKDSVEQGMKYSPITVMPEKEFYEKITKEIELKSQAKIKFNAVDLYMQGKLVIKIIPKD